MATTATFSGTIAGFRQGVSIRTPGQMFGAVDPRLFGGDSTVLVNSRLSGSGIMYATPDSPFFYDDSAGIGSERLSHPGYKLIVNHGFEQLNYGDTELFQLPAHGNSAKKIKPFLEQNMPITGSSPGEFLELTQPEYSGTLPLRLRYQSIQALGQMDGVIEVFPIRKIIDHTMPLTVDRFPGIHVDLSFMASVASFVGPSSRPSPSLYPQYEIMQEMNFTEKLTHPLGTLNPFNDRSNAASGSMTLQLQSSQLTQIPLYRSAGSGSLSYVDGTAFFQNYFTSSIHPYSDSTRTEGQHDAVFSRLGRGLAPVDASLTGVLLQMTSTYDYPMFDKHVYGMPAGFTYALSHMTGWKMGTDSIAFGGWKK